MMSILSIFFTEAMMDNNVFAKWYETAGQLGRMWAGPMTFKHGVSVEADDIRDLLVDFWLERGGVGEEFEERNRGRLYMYVVACISHSAKKDAVDRAISIHDIIGDGEEDRLAALGHVNEEDEAAEEPPQLAEAVEMLRAIRSERLSGVLAEIFDVTDRSGRNFAAEIRREKVRSLIMQAARGRGLTQAQVAKLAAEIARMERAKPGAKMEEIDAFEALFSAMPSARLEKTRLQPAKKRPAVEKRPAVAAENTYQQALFV